MESMASFKEMKLVPHERIDERIEMIRTLLETETESYEIVKDQQTGEHYLLYSYIHLQIADGSVEQYHHFMPVDTDDVLALVLGEQAYTYPDHWDAPFLRNGPEGSYVWFDPAHTDGYAAFEREGEQITKLLQQFKEQGQFGIDAMNDLMKELDRIKKREGSD